MKWASDALYLHKISKISLSFDIAESFKKNSANLFECLYSILQSFSLLMKRKFFKNLRNFFFGERLADFYFCRKVEKLEAHCIQMDPFSLNQCSKRANQSNGLNTGFRRLYTLDCGFTYFQDILQFCSKLNPKACWKFQHRRSKSFSSFFPNLMEGWLLSVGVRKTFI